MLPESTFGRVVGAAAAVDALTLGLLLAEPAVHWAPLLLFPVLAGLMFGAGIGSARAVASAESTVGSAAASVLYWVGLFHLCAYAFLPVATLAAEMLATTLSLLGVGVEGPQFAIGFGGYLVLAGMVAIGSFLGSFGLALGLREVRSRLGSQPGTGE